MMGWFVCNVASPIDETSDAAAEYGVKVEDGRLNYEGKWSVQFASLLCMVDKVTELCDRNIAGVRTGRENLGYPEFSQPNSNV